MTSLTLEDFGLDAGWREAFERANSDPRSQLGRIVSVHYGGSFVRTEHGVVLATTTPSARRGRRSETKRKPAVGDWVVLRPQGDTALLELILPRRTQLLRRAAGEAPIPQIVAANVDVMLVCMALGADFNVRRVQRYFALLEDADGALEAIAPAVVLTKCDTQTPEEVQARVAELHAEIPECTVHPVSTLAGVGLDALCTQLVNGRTAVLLGSSGVGKSTLLNALAGAEHMAAGAVRAKDEKGRHTTTHRELFRLPSGALMIDTPGLREVGLLDEDDVGARRPRRGSGSKARHTSLRRYK